MAQFEQMLDAYFGENHDKLSREQKAAFNAMDYQKSAAGQRKASKKDASNADVLVVDMPITIPIKPLPIDPVKPVTPPIIGNILDDDDDTDDDC